MKLDLISMLGLTNHLLLRFLSEGESFELKKHAQSLSEIIWQGILVAKAMDSIEKRLEELTNMPTFNLTVFIFHGGR